MMHNILTKFTLLILLSNSQLLHAATLDSITDALAIKTAEDFTNNSWENTSKIKGVKWKWPFYQSGAHLDSHDPMHSTMLGRAKIGKSKNPNVGFAILSVIGLRDFITNISLSIANESHQIDEFGKANVAKIKASCDDDSASNAIGFYKFEKAGATGIESGGSVDFDIANSLETGLKV